MKLNLPLAILALASVGRGASIHNVDFRNFAYPFIQSQFVSVPDHLRWMPHTRSSVIATHNGQHTFRCNEPACQLLTVDHVVFGTLSGLPLTTAIVTTTFHTGGTANWQYVYIVGLRAGMPYVAAWLEAGSRADMGLRSASVRRGDLVLTVNDPNKREGDCCSTRSITYRYRWFHGAFHQIGSPVLADDSQ